MLQRGDTKEHKVFVCAADGKEYDHDELVSLPPTPLHFPAPGKRCDLASGIAMDRCFPIYSIPNLAPRYFRDILRLAHVLVFNKELPLLALCVGFIYASGINATMMLTANQGVCPYT